MLIIPIPLKLGTWGRNKKFDSQYGCGWTGVVVPDWDGSTGSPK
ncbi:MAG: hypothetical protein ACKVJJ_02565 [Fidelibacterota bacterium]